MKRAVSWTPIYLAIVLVIAAILIYTIAKPMFQSAATYAQQLGFLLF